MIGRTNALAAGCKIKFASGTATTAIENISGKYYSVARVTGLDFQPSMVMFGSEYAETYGAIERAGTIVFDTEGVVAVTSYAASTMSWFGETMQMTKELNPIKNGFVAVYMGGHTSSAEAQTRTLHWYAVGV